MIKCNVVTIKNEIKSINISGHAMYAEPGSDIVCSAVSMLSYAIANKIISIDEQFDLLITDSQFEFINNLSNSTIDVLLETLYEGLLMVEDQYSKYINIEEVKL